MRGDLRRQENKWNASERRDLPTRLGIRGVLKASSHFCAPIHHSCAPIRYLPLDERQVTKPKERVTKCARRSDEAACRSDEAARGSNKPACRNEATPSANAMFLTNEDFDATLLP